jgi:hypothetical protein
MSTYLLILHREVITVNTEDHTNTQIQVQFEDAVQVTMKNAAFCEVTTYI